MCLNPIQIVNPTKYISLKYRDPFLLHVPCGKCAECQQTLSNQWYLRAWQECQDVNNSGYCYFDTLTYNDNTLPYMDEIIPDLPHISCFRPIDIRNFIESLRIHLKRYFVGASFRYFIASEYGSTRFTNRPHYHVLFFVRTNDTNLNSVVFSSLVSKFWHYGRTDGFPWKSAGYVNSHNVISGSALPADYLRACRYVTKYVQKSCLFSSDLEKRLNNAMFSIAAKMYDGWLDTVNAKRVRMKLKRCIAQFHRQSKGFGSSLLSYVDLQSLFESGVIYMPSPKGLKIPVPLPMYYKRKLFYDLIEIDGTKVWKLNKLGIEYRNYRLDKLISDLADLFFGVSLTYKLGFTLDYCLELSEYVYKTQGRIKADTPSNDILEKLPSVTLFNYVTMSDKENLLHCGVVDRFLGNNSIGYKVDELPASYRIKDFIAKYVFLDEDKEKHLNSIYFHLSNLNDGKQNCFSLRQRLESVYKDIRATSNTFGCL